MKTIIKVYENDYDYNYENYFLVDISKEEKEQLYNFMDELRKLDTDERIEKYNEESSISIIENYITSNFNGLSCDRIDIDCYEI